MAINKPSLPSGTRDFSPQQVLKRNYIISVIEDVFQKYGFMPLQTPAMENIETLTGKYGDEGDQLIFKILNSRVHEAKDEKKTMMLGDFNKMLEENYSPKSILEKALRYDLTVPFARYVVMHRNEITFPFKRYQVQPVWRADRPQKGRFREFWQCDADIVGSNSLINEVDLICIYAEVFETLKLNAEIRINNRKILAGIAEVLNAGDKMLSMVIAIDKLDKIGWEGVSVELGNIGYSTEQVRDLQNVFQDDADSNHARIDHLSNFLASSSTGLKGIEEIQTVLAHLDSFPSIKRNVKLDLTLARGLNYYTGIIIEVVTDEVKLGSIGGGGRYDDLTGIFGLPGVSGVGISFGLDRIYEALDELNRFPSLDDAFTQLLFCCMDESTLGYALTLAKECRKAGIKTEVYPDAVKLKKQLDYANSKNISFAVIIGEQEMQDGLLTLKNLSTGAQNKLKIDQVIEELKKT
jgi:histidyl-tRNA synthetase